jgi:serine/threonine-protein kinase
VWPVVTFTRAEADVHFSDDIILPGLLLVPAWSSGKTRCCSEEAYRKSMTLPVGTRLGRYEVISQIGAGGMAEVYLAEDSRLQRNVALKILPAELASNRDRMRRFEQEAMAAARLNHPNIAHIYEIGESDGVNYIAMEFVEGQTLRQCIHGGQSDLPKLLRHLQHVADGLAKAHAAGIVHRDLKPDNVMITLDGHAKVLDFGLAKLIEPQEGSQIRKNEVGEAATEIQHSTPGVVLGTVGYMSPEQAQGKTNQIDHRSDIFSFGCILHEAVTGRRAFQGSDSIDTLNKIIREPAAPISEFRPDAPNHLQRIVRRCLAKDPEDRYQTMKDVAIELRELRRDLAGTAGIDVTLPPSSSVASALGSVESPAKVPSGEARSTSSSSAEYIVTGIKRHKVAAIIALLVFVAGAVGLGMYLQARSSAVAIESIAVLPFVNQSGDPETEYLCDGLTESIINSLTQLPSLRVSPRSSVFQYKGKDADPMSVGSGLGVRAVLTGRLQQRGNSLVVSAELLDLRENKQVWGEQYNRKLADALAVQQEISREISERLRTKLTGEEQKQLTRRDTVSPEAYSSYLKGRYYWNKRTAENISKAIEEFQQAVDRDPNYALAYAGLADCYGVLEEYSGTPTSETLPKAQAFAQRALQLDGSLAEAETSLAFAHHQLWQWEEAEEGFKRSIKLNPGYATAHHWYSLYLNDVGRLDEAMIEIKRAQELDPISAIIALNMAQAYLNRRDFGPAMEQTRRMLELDPNFPRGHETLGAVYVLQGQVVEAITHCQRAVDLSFRRDRRILRTLGYAYAVAGRRSEALAILKELQQRYEKREASPIDPAAIYAGLGDKDQAFAWLEIAFQNRNSRLGRTRWETGFELLRGDARYADLMRRMGVGQ